MSSEADSNKPGNETGDLAGNQLDGQAHNESNSEPAGLDSWLATVINDPEQPLVLFGVDWCEFCQAARRLFKAIGAPYRWVDVEALDLQQPGRGREIREHLEQLSGQHTVPQIFLAGRPQGGATDVFDAWKEGQLQKGLDAAGVEYQHVEDFNPWNRVSSWMHGL